MNYRQSRQLKDKNTHFFLGVVFAVFIFTQLITIQHQIQHLNDFNDIACVQCIILPDQLDDSSLSLFIFHPQESTAYKITYEIKPSSLTLKAYSARAPPSIT